MSHEKALNICLIGCGQMGGLHARSIARHRSVAQLTLCDAVDEAAQTLTDELADTAIVRQIAAIDSALSEGDFDAFVIASPPRFHLEQMARAVSTGAYVFCEKPLGEDYHKILKQLDQLQADEERIQIGFNRRFDPQMAALKARLDGGAIGMIEQLHIVSRDHTPPTLEQLPSSAGLIRETAIHDFDMIRWLLGNEIAQIACHGSALVNPAYTDHGHIDTATMVMISHAGQQVVLQNSWRATNGYDQRIEAFGPKGRLNVGNPLSDLVVFEGRNGACHGQIADDWSTRYIEAYAIEMAAFIDCVAARRPPSPSLTDGVEASKLAHFAHKSLVEKRIITLS